MKLNNCLFCCVHKDNGKYNKCFGIRHRFVISENQSKKYDWAIDYIKKEVKDGRHIIARLGSAGYTFTDDINNLKNYAYGKGDEKFYELLNQL